jgi:hypothetical protein
MFRRLARRHCASRFASWLRLLIPVTVGGFIVSGCGGESAVRGGGALLERGAQQAAARQAAVDLAPTLARFSARTELVERAAAKTAVTVHSEADAAAAVKASPPIGAVAEESSADIRTIADNSTTDATASARVQRCAKGAALAAGKSYGSNLVLDKPAPEVRVAITKSVGSCLQRAFPKQAVAVRYATDAITRSMLTSSKQVGETHATAQDYSDWLIYSASLYTQDAAADEPAPAPAPPSALDRSVDDVLVVLFHAHAGRVAVRHRDWQAAIDNRGKVLDELRELQVTSKLREIRLLLIRAMKASLASDRGHAACDRCVSPHDAQATSYKRAIANRFNPYLEARYRAHIRAADF